MAVMTKEGVGIRGKSEEMTENSDAARTRTRKKGHLLWLFLVVENLREMQHQNVFVVV
jgi:hypothetical protein